MGTEMAKQSGGMTTGGMAADTRDPDGGCRVDDLRGLLERITTQIAESERRQTETLSSMLSRLDTLGAEARSYKGKVPAHLLPAFERIEESVAALAERIASVRDDGAAAPAMAMPPADHVEPMAPAVAAAAVAPAFAAAPIYDFDSVMPNDEHAWDRDAADALARHYEAQSGYEGPMPDPERAPPRKAERIAAAAPQGRASDIERSWLEDRFADIARRIETSLAETAPDASISTLGSRFDKLEQRFGSALDSVATRSDVEGLRILEAHITELTNQFDETRTQLGRLDGIEQTLAAVVDRLTDPRFDDILERGASAAETDLEPLISAAVEQIASRLKTSSDASHADLSDIADAAAERVATRFADMGQADAGASGDMTQIRQLLEHFINERREGDEQTAAMLDTMQQAMIRMLDRVDSLEVAQSKSTPQEYVREQVRFGVDNASGAATGAHKAAEAASAFAAEARKPIAPAASHFEEADRTQRPFVAEVSAPVHMPPAAPIPMTPPPAGASVASATNRPAGTGATIERLRHDFIADAQRAKLKAAAAAEADANATAQPAAAQTRTPITDASAAVPLAKARARQEAAAEAKRSALSRMPSRKLLVSAIVLLVAIPGLIMLAQKRAANSVALPPAATEAPAEAAKTSTAPAMIENAAPATKAATGDAAPTIEPAAARSDSAPAAKDEPVTEPAGERHEAPADAGKDTRTIDGTIDKERRSDIPADASSTSGSGRAEAGPSQPFDAPAIADAIARARTASATPAPGALPLPRAPMGIHVASPGKAPTLEQINRLQQRRSMAEMSSQLGAAQQPNATLAALIPDADAAAAGIDPAAVIDGTMLPQKQTSVETSGHARKALDMPPAAVGPLSLRMSAANGDASAEFEVGARFAEGNGMEQNFAEASRWYQRSATQGFAQAQYRLATLYERGLGVKQDVNRAKVWYQRSAEGGNIKAMHNLAVLSAGRTAKTPDYTTAATWFTAAAERGLADSQFNLAVLHESGLGVGKDQKAAYKWFALAARGGDAEAVKRRDELERTMLPADLAQARKEVSGWRSKATDRIANDARAAGEDWKSRARASGDI